MSPEKQYRLASDNDGHWYVIPVKAGLEFEAWLTAMENDEDWTGENFEAFGIDYPEEVQFPSWTIIK